MSFKQIFVFVAVLLCAQYTLCNVMNTKESDDLTQKSILAVLKKKLNAEDRSDTSFEKSLDERAKLMRLMIGEFFALAQLSVTPAKNLFKDVIADVGNLNNSDGTPYPYLTEIKDLVNEIEKIEETQNKDVIANVQLYIVLAKLMQKFEYEENAEMSTTEGKQFSESLEKNGYESFEAEIKIHFIAFVDKMYKAALNYWNTLSDDEKVEEQKFGDWLTKMKEEQMEEERCDLFGDIFDLLK